MGKFSCGSCNGFRCHRPIRGTVAADSPSHLRTNTITPQPRALVPTGARAYLTARTLDRHPIKKRRFWREPQQAIVERERYRDVAVYVLHGTGCNSLGVVWGNETRETTSMTRDARRKTHTHYCYLPYMGPERPITATSNVGKPTLLTYESVFSAPTICIRFHVRLYRRCGDCV